MTEPKAPEVSPQHEEEQRDIKHAGEADASPPRKAQEQEAMPGYGQPPPDVRNPNTGGK